MAALTALTPYGRGGASSRVRVFEWLARVGLDHEVHSYIGQSNSSPGTMARAPRALVRAERAIRELDPSSTTLLLHREASPLSRGGVEVRLLRRARRGLFDFDDALQWDVRRGLRSMVPKPSKAERCVQAADVVIAGSDVLADWASRFAAEVHLVPTCIEPRDYPLKPDYVVSGPPVVGWVGSPTTERHLGLIAEPLLTLHRLTGARLTVVSSGHASLGPLDEIADRVPWDAGTVGQAIASFDVAVAPLVVDLYSRGKCAYKVLQYAAAGLPIVGTPVGANQQALGRLGAATATTELDWLTQMHDLVTASESDRAALGATARRQAAAFYSYESWTPTMHRLLSGGSPTTSLA